MSLIEEPDPEQDAELASLLQKLCELEESGDGDSQIEDRLDNLSESQLADLFGAGKCLNLLHRLNEDKAANVSRIMHETSRNQDTIKEDRSIPEHHVPNQIGRYEIIRLAAQGGFARVYEAKDSRLNRNVALKVPLSERLADQHAIERFQREARAVAMLSHPAIVPVYEAGEAEGQPFIALKWIEGQSLHRFLKDRDMPIPPSDAAKAIERISEAVAHAHSKGILHRDIKPANILISESLPSDPKRWFESVSITDFGLAKHLADSGPQEFNTIDGAILGTPAYMSPEQVRSDGEIGPAADVYSLGIVLYELLVGKTPHRKTSYAGTIRAIESEQPKPIRTFRDDVPRDLIAICNKSLSKDPKLRYQSAFELAEDLQRFREGFPIKAKPAGGLYKFSRWLQRNPVVATCLGLALVGLTVGLLATIRSNFKIAAARDDSQRQVEILEMIFSDLDYNRDGDVLSEPDLRKRIASRLVDSVDLIAESDDTKTGSRVLGTLGRALATLGHPNESRSCIQKAIELGGNQLDADQQASLQVRLSGAVMAQGKFDEARTILENVIREVLDSPSQVERIKSDTQVYLAESTYQTAKIKRDAITQARKYFQEFQAWLSESELADRTKTRYSSYAKFRIAGCEYMTEPNEDASETLYQRFGNVVRDYGPEHTISISAAYEMATVLRQQSRFEDSLKISETALVNAKKKFGLGAMPTLLAYDSVLITCGMNSMVPQYKTRLIELLPEMETCCEAVLKDIGKAHPDMISIYGNVAIAWGISGDLDKCAGIKSRLLELAEKEFGREHAFTQQQLYGLALTYIEAKENKKARLLLEEFLRTHESGVLLDPAHVKLVREHLRKFEQRKNEAVSN